MLAKMEAIDLNLEDKQKAQLVTNYLSDFCISQPNLDKLKLIFEQELAEGLQHGLSGSCLQMENTYVTEMTNGLEQGQYLALDLGGTNFRVMLLEINSGQITREEVCSMLCSIIEKRHLFRANK